MAPLFRRQISDSRSPRPDTQLRPSHARPTLPKGQGAAPQSSTAPKLPQNCLKTAMLEPLRGVQAAATCGDGRRKFAESSPKVRRKSTLRENGIMKEQSARPSRWRPVVANRSRHQSGNNRPQKAPFLPDPSCFRPQTLQTLCLSNEIKTPPPPPAPHPGRPDRADKGW